MFRKFLNFFNLVRRARDEKNTAVNYKITTLACAGVVNGIFEIVNTSLMVELASGGQYEMLLGFQKLHGKDKNCVRFSK